MHKRENCSNSYYEQLSFCYFKSNFSKLRWIINLNSHCSCLWLSTLNIIATPTVVLLRTLLHCLCDWWAASLCWDCQLPFTSQGTTRRSNSNSSHSGPWPCCWVWPRSSLSHGIRSELQMNFSSLVHNKIHAIIITFLYFRWLFEKGKLAPHWDYFRCVVNIPEDVLRVGEPSEAGEQVTQLNCHSTSLATITF